MQAGAQWLNATIHRNDNVGDDLWQGRPMFLSTPSLAVNQRRTKEAVMGDIQGEDHKRLAELLDVRVSNVEDRLGGMEDKFDSLAASVNQMIGKMSLIDKTPTTMVEIIGKNPWMVPVVLILGAVLFGSGALLDYLKR